MFPPGDPEQILIHQPTPGALERGHLQAFSAVLLGAEHYRLRRTDSSGFDAPHAIGLPRCHAVDWRLRTRAPEVHLWKLRGTSRNRMGICGVRVGQNGGYRYPGYLDELGSELGGSEVCDRSAVSDASRTDPAHQRLSLHLDSHDEATLASELADGLRAHRLQVWIDEDELKIGDSIIERIATAIAGIDFFLILVSEASRESNWCRKELSLAVTGELGREGVAVLPVRVRGAEIPEALRDKLHLDLDQGNVADVARKIADAVPKHQIEQRAAIAGRKEAARRPTPKPKSFGNWTCTRVSRLSESSASSRKASASPVTTALLAARSTGCRSAFHIPPHHSGRSISEIRGIARHSGQQCIALGSPPWLETRSFWTELQWMSSTSDTTPRRSDTS